MALRSSMVRGLCLLGLFGCDPTVGSGKNFLRMEAVPDEGDAPLTVRFTVEYRGDVDELLQGSPLVGGDEGRMMVTFVPDAHGELPLPPASRLVDPDADAASDEMALSEEAAFIDSEGFDEFPIPTQYDEFEAGVPVPGSLTRAKTASDETLTFEYVYRRPGTYLARFTLWGGLLGEDLQRGPVREHTIVVTGTEPPGDDGGVDAGELGDTDASIDGGTAGSAQFEDGTLTLTPATSNLPAPMGNVDFTLAWNMPTAAQLGVAEVRYFLWFQPHPDQQPDADPDGIAGDEVDPAGSHTALIQYAGVDETLVARAWIVGELRHTNGDELVEMLDTTADVVFAKALPGYTPPVANTTTVLPVQYAEGISLIPPGTPLASANSACPAVMHAGEGVIVYNACDTTLASVVDWDARTEFYAFTLPGVGGGGHVGTLWGGSSSQGVLGSDGLYDGLVQIDPPGTQRYEFVAPVDESDPTQGLVVVQDNHVRLYRAFNNYYDMDGARTVTDYTRVYECAVYDPATDVLYTASALGNGTDPKVTVWDASMSPPVAGASHPIGAGPRHCDCDFASGLCAFSSQTDDQAHLFSVGAGGALTAFAAPAATGDGPVGVRISGNHVAIANSASATGEITLLTTAGGAVTQTQTLTPAAGCQKPGHVIWSGDNLLVSCYESSTPGKSAVAWLLGVR